MENLVRNVSSFHFTQLHSSVKTERKWFLLQYWSCRFFDTSKQAIGALFIHFANVFLSTLTEEDPCSLWVIYYHRQTMLRWDVATRNVSPKKFLVFATGISWTSCWTPRWGCWSSGWPSSWCQSWWSTSSGRCSCLENMVSELWSECWKEGDVALVSTKRGQCRLAGSKEESHHLQLQQSPEDAPGGFREWLTPGPVITLTLSNVLCIPRQRRTCDHLFLRGQF